MKKLFFSLTAAIVLHVCGLAQETQIRADHNFLFNEGRDLYNQQKFSASRKAFEVYVLSANPNSSAYQEAQYYIASCAYALKDDRTSDLLTAYIETYPYSPMNNRVMYMLGRLAFEKGNYKQAVNHYNQLSADDLNGEEKIEMLFTQGYSYLQQKDYINAKQAFVSLDVSSEGESYRNEALYFTAYTDYCMGDYTTALENFVQCTGTGYAEPAAYHTLQIYDQLGESGKAVETGKALVQRFPNSPYNAEAYRILGESSYREGNFTDAVTYLNRYSNLAEKVHRNDMYMLGLACYQTDNCAAAIEHLSKVTTQTDSLSQNAYLHIGHCQLKLNNFSKARMAYQTASLQPIDRVVQEEALYNYAIVTNSTGSVLGESVKAFTRFLTEFPNSGHTDEIYSHLATAYLSEKNYAAAYEAMKQLKSNNPKLVLAKEYILFQMGVSELAEKHYDKAETFFSQSIALHSAKSFSQQAYLWRAEVYYQQKNYAKCRADLNTFLSKKQGRSSEETLKAYYTMAYTYFEEDAYSQSLTWLLKYIKEGDKNDKTIYMDVLNRTADCYFHRRDFKTATGYYSKAIEVLPRMADYATFQRAFIAGLEKNYAQKIRELETLLKNYPASRYAANARYEIGRAYVLQENYSQAVKTYQEVIAKHSKTPLARKAAIEVGMIYTNMNEHNKAIEAYKKIVSAYPGSEEALTALESMQSLYVEENRVNEYTAYRQSLRGAGNSLQREQEDSLTFTAAERLYTKSDYTAAATAFDGYIKNFCTSNSLRCVTALYYQAESYVSLKEFDRALTAYDRLTHIDGNRHMEHALTQAANIAFDKKDFNAAASYFDQLQQSSDKPETKSAALLGTLRCRYRLNQYEQVVDAASLILNDVARDANRIREARYCRAKAYIALNEVNSAIDDLKTITADTRHEMGAEASYLLAGLYFTKNNLTDAETEIMRLLKEGSPHQYWIARSFVLLADICINRQDDFQAKQYLLSLQENYKTHDDIQPMIIQRLNAIAKREGEKVY